jgi:predicted N-acyltransferase
MFQATLHRSIQDIPCNEWDEIIDPNNIFASHRWLALVQDGSVKDCKCTYVVIRSSDGKIAAHFCAYTIKTSMVIFSHGLIKNFVNIVRILFPDFCKTLILECGGALNIGNPISIRSGINFSDIAMSVCEALESYAKLSRIRLIVLRDFRDDESAAMSIIEKHGYSKMMSLATTRLNICWSSFQQYLSSMKSYYRRKIRIKLLSAAQTGLTVKINHEFANIAIELASQVKNVDDRAKEYNRDILLPRFYENLNYAVEKCMVLEVRKSNRIVAHALILIHNQTLSWLTFGTATNEIRNGSYFLVIAHIIDIAIKEHVKNIEMGLTTYRAKTDFGAVVIPLSIYVCARGRFFKRIVELVLKYLNQVPEAPNKNVFK